MDAQSKVAVFKGGVSAGKRCLEIANANRRAALGGEIQPQPSTHQGKDEKMDRKFSGGKALVRLQIGDTILGAAQVVNAKSLKARLDAFADAHRSYCEAQRRVDAVEAELIAEQARLQRLDVDQDEAIETLALCLAGNGHKRTNPFSSFSTVPPGRMKQLPFGEEAQAIHALVATLQRSKLVPQATLDAAQRAEQAAQKVEAALPTLETLRSNLRSARETRDTIAQSWDANLTALRLAARATSVVESPGLYAAWFGHMRAARKAKSPVAPPSTVPSTTPPATLSSTATTPAA